MLGYGESNECHALTFFGAYLATASFSVYHWASNSRSLLGKGGPKSLTPKKGKKKKKHRLF